MSIMRIAGPVHNIASRLSTLSHLGKPRRALCINHGCHHLLEDHPVDEGRRPSSIRYYSNTPLLLKRSLRPSLYRSETRSNEKLENKPRNSEKIEHLKRKIKDLSEGRQPQPEQRRQQQQQQQQPRKNKKALAREAEEQSYAKPKRQRERRINNNSPRVEKQRPNTVPTPKPLRAPFSVFISCLPGLEPILLQEVQYLQSQWEQFSSTTTTPPKTKTKQKETTRTVAGGVKVILPTLAHIYILHLYLGTASHIYLRLNDDNVDGIHPLFRARGFPELRRKLKDMMVSQQWDKLLDIPIGGQRNLPWELQVHVTTSKSKLMHTKAVEERVWETVGDVLGIYKPRSGVNGGAEEVNEGANGTNMSKNNTKPIVRLLVRIDRDVVQLSLDTSSSSAAVPLHMRGYRLNPFKAPLREDLAFALLLAGGLKPSWNLHPLQSWLPRSDDISSNTSTGDAPKAAASLQLLDPFCGSGTIAIEGCAILAGLPPGRFRSTPLQGTKMCDPSLWDDMKSNALSVSSLSSSGNNANKTLVAANDINKEAIHAAKSNAKRAGVEEFIDFRTGSFKIHPLLKKPEQTIFKISQSQPLLVVTNPPYGKRLSLPSESKSSSTYKQLAKALFSSPYEIGSTIIGKDIRSLRESSLPLGVAFSTKQGGLSVVAMTGTIDKPSRKGHHEPSNDD
ncbi:hypothetical protein ACHAXR_013458 [Thalassiosira sp. AJA248-18]